MREDDDGASIANKREKHYSVAVEAVEKHRLVSDHRRELKHHQASCGKDHVQVQHHADLVRVLEIPVAFAWRSAGGAAVVGVAEDAVEGEILEAG